ncbi:MAG: DUF3105 domain-containing protein, partial [bacterium]|nr:DUF3105 domain-containing protein [bacterium]
MKKPIIIGAIIVVVLGVGIALSIPDQELNELKVSGDSEAEQVGQSYENQGSKHIDIDTPRATANSNPPTSGDHLATPADWGVYQNELPDVQLIHNLEHGGIWISYKDIDAETKAKIEAIGKANPGSVIVTPRAANDSKIAITSWTRLEKMDSYDEAKILQF